MLALIDPELGMSIVRSCSWGMIVWGVIHLGIYLIGEFFPKAYNWLKSEGLRKLFIGNANRLVWGVGGIVLILMGFAFLFFVKLLEKLDAAVL